MIVVIAKLRIAPGAMAPVLEHVAGLARRARAELGCHEYTYLRSPEDDDLLERWADRSSLSAHLASSDIAAYRKATAPYVVDRSLTVFDAVEVAT